MTKKIIFGAAMALLSLTSCNKGSNNESATLSPSFDALMYVNNSGISLGSTSFSISSADLTAAQKLVNTYVVILKSRTALTEVIEKAGLDYSYEKLKSMISASAVNSTEVFEIVVTSPSPTEAEKIANTIAVVLPGKIADIVNGSDVRIVDYAVVPSHRHSPSYTRNTAVGILLGIVVVAAILVLAYLFDEIIHSEDYLSGHSAPVRDPGHDRRAAALRLWLRLRLCVLRRQAEAPWGHAAGCGQGLLRFGRLKGGARE